MHTRGLITLVSVALVALAASACGDAPSNAADRTLPGAPQGPALEEGPGELELGAKTPEPGASPGCGDDDLQCICELTLSVFDRCGGFLFDGESIDIPRDACKQAELTDALVEEYCPRGDCSQVNRLLTCVADTPVCTQDTFTGCARALGGFNPVIVDGQPTQDTRFVCSDGGRVPFDWVCDGDLDCDDGSDEADCN